MKVIITKWNGYLYYLHLIMSYKWRCTGGGVELKLWLVLLFQKGWNLCLCAISTYMLVTTMKLSRPMGVTVDLLYVDPFYVMCCKKCFLFSHGKQGLVKNNIIEWSEREKKFSSSKESFLKATSCHWTGFILYHVPSCSNTSKDNWFWEIIE